MRLNRFDADLRRGLIVCVVLLHLNLILVIAALVARQWLTSLATLLWAANLVIQLSLIFSQQRSRDHHRVVQAVLEKEMR